MTTAVSTEAAHSEYGASSAKRWTSCLASPRMCRNTPPSFDEEWTIDGKVAHSLLEFMLTMNDDDASSWVGNTVTYDGDGKELLQGVVKPETARAVQIAYDYVAELKERDPSAQVWIEARVRVPSTVVPDKLYGTADVIVYLPLTGELFVIDYKHGAGIFVDVVDNMQLKFYLLGVFMSDMIVGPISEMTIAIMQPRAYGIGEPVRTSVIDLAELLRFHGWLDDRAALTLDDRASFVPDKDYCRFCPAATICKAYEMAALGPLGATSVEDLLTKTLPAPKDMPLAHVAAVERAAPMIRSYLNANRPVALGFAKAGYDLPGLKVVNTQSRRVWYGNHDDIAVALSLLTGQPEEKVYPRTLLGITEAEELVVSHFRDGVQPLEKESKKSRGVRGNKAAEMAREALANLTLKEPGGGITLAPLTDPRPRVDAAASNFAGLVHVDPQE